MHKVVSKWMSYVLRHHPEEYKLVMDDEGFVPVEDLISAALGLWSELETKDQVREVIDHVVLTNDKRRFEYSLCRNSIRACQGHSVKLNMTFTNFVPSEILYHGTAEKNLNSIAISGILKGARNYVHLSDNIATAMNVGSRHGVPVVLGIKAQDMMRDGFKFFISNNGVILVDHVPAKYLSQIFSKMASDVVLVNPFHAGVSDMSNRFSVEALMKMRSEFSRVNPALPVVKCDPSTIKWGIDEAFPNSVNTR